MFPLQVDPAQEAEADCLFARVKDELPQEQPQVREKPQWILATSWACFELLHQAQSNLGQIAILVHSMKATLGIGWGLKNAHEAENDMILSMLPYLSLSK